MKRSTFDWDLKKAANNLDKHNISFVDAQKAFLDPLKIIAVDKKHSTPSEKRFFCFGNVNGGIATVRFTIRGNTIRIFGAGYWRKGRIIYHEKNQIH